jgi:predicted Zn-ribbon and HTH transcriptional regulator
MKLNHPFSGRRAAIATMHGKEQVMGPVLEGCLGLKVERAERVDTDALGTFTGEIARAGNMLEAARAEALLAVERTGATIGLGSEGAFGPHPIAPFLASGLEVILLLDVRDNHEIVAQRRTRTNYASMSASSGMECGDFLSRTGFPAHAVTVRPEESDELCAVEKGIADLRRLNEVVDSMASRSKTGRALVQTDMRAHVNPTRMKTIGFVAKALALRASRLCPACQTPGFGIIDVVRGLPCGDCGAPTRVVRAEIHGCRKCGHKIIRRDRPASVRADAMWCDSCNP